MKNLLGRSRKGVRPFGDLLSMKSITVEWVWGK